jgi:hypothetical protein
MENTYFADNYPLIEKLLRQDKNFETIKIGNFQPYLDESISKLVNNYFLKNYSKINYQEFLKTNDYYIQRIKLVTEKLLGMRKLDSTNLGLILQEQIIYLGTPIYNAKDNENIRQAVLE